MAELPAATESEEDKLRMLHRMSISSIKVLQLELDLVKARRALANAELPA